MRDDHDRASDAASEWMRELRRDPQATPAAAMRAIGHPCGDGSKVSWDDVFFAYGRNWLADRRSEEVNRTLAERRSKVLAVRAR